MSALLNRRKLRVLEDGCFLYRSRPYEILKFRIQPEVIFKVTLNGECMRIEFLHCRIEGLSGLDKKVDFQCKAFLSPGDSFFHAEAEASLSVLNAQLLPIFAKPVLQRLAKQALHLVFARLEKRCRGGLRKAALQWIDHENKLSVV